MRLLIDTHVLIWAASQSHRLSAAAADLLTDIANTIHVSPVSMYEIEYKRPHDPELQNLPADLNVVSEKLGFAWLPVTAEHAKQAAELPRHHRDPWDRLLLGQAIVEGAALVSIDRRLTDYGVPILW